MVVSSALQHVWENKLGNGRAVLRVVTDTQ